MAPGTIPQCVGGYGFVRVSEDTLCSTSRAHGRVLQAQAWAPGCPIHTVSRPTEALLTAPNLPHATPEWAVSSQDLRGGLIWTLTWRQGLRGCS